MDINSFSEDLQAGIKAALAELNIQPDDLHKITTDVTHTIAAELVKKYMTTALAGVSSENSPLRWTGQKVELVELIYALSCAKVVNEGDADIKPIASAFGRIFNIDLTSCYRVFQDIRMRKTGSTFFLDELRQKLQQKLNAMDDL